MGLKAENKALRDALKSAPIGPGLIRARVESARRNALEEAAKAVELEKYAQAFVDATEREGSQWPQQHNDLCDEIATTIRGLANKGNGAGDD